MPVVMDSHILEPGLVATDAPVCVQITQPAFGCTPRNSPRVTGLRWQVREDLPCGRRKRDHASAGLGGGKAYLAGLEIKSVPTQTEELVSAAAGRQEEADCRQCLVVESAVPSA